LIISLKPLGIVGNVLVTFSKYFLPENAAEVFKISVFFQYNGWKRTYNRQMTKNSMLNVIWFPEHLQTKFQLHIYVTFFT